jgi:hypothetical protein
MAAISALSTEEITASRCFAAAADSDLFHISTHCPNRAMISNPCRTQAPRLYAATPLLRYVLIALH